MPMQKNYIMGLKMHKKDVLFNIILDNGRLC